MAKVLKKKKILFSFLPQWASLLLQLRHDYNLVFIRCGSVASVMSDTAAPCSSVHGILQARILEWVAMPSSRGSSRPRDPTCVSCIPDRFFTTEPQGSPLNKVPDLKVNLEN